MAYRCCYLLARAWWEITRPDHQGALVAVWAAGRLLLVRQSYQRLPAFPGGGVKAGEAPVEAALRELREELGLDVTRHELISACIATERWDGRRDTVSFFEWYPSSEPALRPDGREVVAAAFVNPLELPKAVSAPVGYYLAWREAKLGRGTVRPQGL